LHDAQTAEREQGWRIRAQATLESTFLRSTHKNSSDGW